MFFFKQKFIVMLSVTLALEADELIRLWFPWSLWKWFNILEFVLNCWKIYYVSSNNRKWPLSPSALSKASFLRRWSLDLTSCFTKRNHSQFSLLPSTSRKRTFPTVGGVERAFKSYVRWLYKFEYLEDDFLKHTCACSWGKNVYFVQVSNCL